MAVDTRHLRQVSRNYYGTVAGGATANVGAAVPTGKRRYLFFVRVWHDGIAPELVSLFRDGAVGAVPLDYLSLPGIGVIAGLEIGNTVIELAMNIESPIYILESGERLGVGSPVANSYILATGFDEP